MDRSQKFAPQPVRSPPPGRRTLYAAVAWLSLFTVLPQAAATPNVLTSVGQIRQLPPGAAGRGIPVRLQGVVTAVSGYRNSFFLQDTSGGISVDSELWTPAQAGAKVQVTGRTGAGMFAAVVQSRQVIVLGPGKLPGAPLFAYSDLMGGAQDSNSISVRGVVRSAKIEPLWTQKVLALKVQGVGGPINLLVRKYPANAPQRLVDTVVRARGVCSTAFNQKHQFTGMALFVTDMSDVVIEEPAPIDAYAAAPTLVREVMQFKSGARFTHRILIVGTLTYQDLGHSLYLQDGIDGILVESNQSLAMPLGSRVEAVGFPTAGAYSPVLQEATFRMVRSGKPIAPAPMRAADFLKDRDSFIDAPYDSQLVTLTGQLVETSVRINDGVWLLRDGDREFLATLGNLPDFRKLPVIPDGSIVSATGIFSVQVDEDRKPVSFRVLLRSGGDLVVLRKATWWTSAHSLEVLAALLVVTVGTSVWSVTLRVRVRQQTSMLRKSEERFREQARCDSLTGLANRSFLNEQLDEAIRAAPGRETGIGLLMLDLDHFKQVNDTFGHQAGDELLVVVAKRIRHSVRQSDVVARMGGDEFVVLLKEIQPPNAELVGAKVVAAVCANAQIAGRPMMVSGSVGLCLYPEGGRDSETLLRNVDAAMYAAKAAGRNSFHIYQPGREPSLGAQKFPL